MKGVDLKKALPSRSGSAKSQVESHGVGLAYEGIKRGTSVNYNNHGAPGSWQSAGNQPSSVKLDPAVESKTVKSNKAISQHKRMAMGK